MSESHQSFLRQHLYKHFSLATFAGVRLVCTDGELRCHQLFVHLLLPELPAEVAIKLEDPAVILLPQVPLKSVLSRRAWLADYESDLNLKKTEAKEKVRLNFWRLIISKLFTADPNILFISSCNLFSSNFNIFEFFLSDQTIEEWLEL